MQEQKFVVELPRLDGTKVAIELPDVVLEADLFPNFLAPYVPLEFDTSDIAVYFKVVEPTFSKLGEQLPFIAGEEHYEDELKEAILSDPQLMAWKLLAWHNMSFFMNFISLAGLQYLANNAVVGDKS